MGQGGPRKDAPHESNTIIVSLGAAGSHPAAGRAEDIYYQEERYDSETP